MSRKPIPGLTIDHCKEALSREIIIGSVADCRADVYKRFVFHVWDNEYRVYDKGVVVSSGQAIEELLDDYNNL